MKAELQAALEKVGWESLYEYFVPDLGSTNPRGERRSKSPFPDVSDNNPSFTVNVENGKWRCFNSDRAGDFVHFYAIMTATEFDPITGRANPDYAQAERELCNIYQVTKQLDVQWIKNCNSVLAGGINTQQWIAQHKPWRMDIILALGVGYEESSGRIVFPVYDKKGSLVDARLYKPGGKPKFIWKAGAGANFVWPKEAWRDGQQVILCEGEPDTLSLRSLGFPAFSGTVGCGAPIPDLMFLKGKDLWVLMDNDEAGQEAIERIKQDSKGIVNSLHVIKLPAWEGMPDNADISDVIMQCYRCGLAPDKVQEFVGQIITGAEQVDLGKKELPVEDRRFDQAVSAANVGKKVRFGAKVIAKANRRYILPLQMRISCCAGGTPHCKSCPMNKQFSGNTTLSHDPASEETFHLIEVTDGKQEAFVKKKLGINQQCSNVMIAPMASLDVEPVLVQEPLGEQTANTGTVYKEIYVVLNHREPVEEGNEYDIIGGVYSHPDSQLATFLADEYHAKGEEKFSNIVTPELLRSLEVFRPYPGQTAFDKLMEVARDLEQGVTQIYGRLDLLMAYRTVWHSLLSFDMQGRRVKRGWLEMLVIGDTRAGKTAAFRSLIDWYGLGEVVDCKVQTTAGILGGVDKTPSGKHYIVPGVYPRNDGGIVCFDEFRTLKAGDLISELAVPRSEGVVKISKIVSGEFKSRVRSVWLANPGKGVLISQQALTGIELLVDLMPQPEDISRFDFAMVVRQQDVPQEELTKVHTAPPPRYSQDISRYLLRWAHSIETVFFTPDAIAAMERLAENMCARFSTTIPLVEPADQIRRIARLVVSVAAQCFSTDDYVRLIVTDDHVDAVRRLFDMWYTHPAMAYGEFTDLTKDEVGSVNSQQIQQYFNSFGEKQGKQFARELMRVEVVTQQHANMVFPGGPIMAAAASPIASLQSMGCLKANDRGRKFGYVKTQSFVDFLRKYLGK